MAAPCATEELDRITSDLSERGSFQTCRKTRSRLLDLLDPEPDDNRSIPLPCESANLAKAATPTEGVALVNTDNDPQAGWIAAELQRLYQDGAIGMRSEKDPDALFYASVLHIFGASYVGLVGQKPASAKLNAESRGNVGLGNAHAADRSWAASFCSPASAGVRE
jgi:hypothetical protein